MIEAYGRRIVFFPLLQLTGLGKVVSTCDLFLGKIDHFFFFNHWNNM